MNSQKPSRIHRFISAYARAQIAARGPSLLKSAVFLFLAGVAGAFASIWASVAVWTAFRDGAEWSRAGASLGTALVFAIIGGVFISARKRIQARRSERTAIETELREAVPSRSGPVSGLVSAARADASEALRRNGEEAWSWMRQHPVRAALLGAAAGWLVGTWTRKAFNDVEIG